MSSIEKLKKAELKQCQAYKVTDCGLTLEKVKALESNPAGTSKGDELNPDYKGKVIINGDKLVINLNYVLTGNIDRAKAGLKNITDIYAAAMVTINFSPNPAKFDLRIHGATLAEFAQGLKLCDCDAALLVGGWAPSPKHYKWGKALLLNSTTPKSEWPLVDAHEFGHKLGLKHRTDLGIMDYPPKKGIDRRKVTESDKKRIMDLYK